MNSPVEDLPENTTLTRFNNTTVDTLQRNWLGHTPTRHEAQLRHGFLDSVDDYSDEEVRLCLFRLYERRVEGWYVDKIHGGLWLNSWLIESFADKAIIVKCRIQDAITSAILQHYWQEDWGFTKFWNVDGIHFNRRFNLRLCRHARGIVCGLVTRRLEKRQQCYEHGIGLNEFITQEHCNECDQVATESDTWQNALDNNGCVVQWTDE